MSRPASTGAPSIVSPARAAMALLAAGAVAAPLAFSTDIAAFADTPKRAVLHVSTALAATAWIAFGGGLRPRRVPAALLWAGAFWLAISLALARGPLPFEAFHTWLHWSLGLVAYGAAFAAIRSGANPSGLLAAMRWTVVAVLALAYLRYYGALEGIPQKGPPTASTFGNRNWHAQFLVLGLPLLGLTDWPRRKTLVCLRAAPPALALAFLLKINSSAAYLAVLAQGVALAARVVFGGDLRGLGRALARNKGPLVFFAALTALAAAHTREGFRDPVSGIAAEAKGATKAIGEGAASAPPSPTSAPPAKRTVADRLGVYAVTSTMAFERPLLGLGLGEFAASFPEYNRRAGHPNQLSMAQRQQHAHNDWLQLAAECGLAAFVPIIGWMALAAGRIRATWRDAPGNSRPALRTHACAAGLVGIAVFGLFSYPFHNAVPPFYAALFGAVLAASPAENAAPSDRPRRRWPRWAVLALAIAATAGLACRESRVWRYEHHLARVQGAMNAGRWWPIVERGAEMRELLPRRHTHRPYLAQAYLALGEEERAQDVAERYSNAYPHDAAVHAILGASLRARGRDEAALPHLRKAAELMPNETKFQTLLRSAAQ